MSTIESADQAAEFLDRAQELLVARRDNEAYQLLEAVEQSNLLAGQHRPRMLWLLGESCYRGGSYDAAAQYYEQAVAAGDADIAQQARDRLAEFGRMDTARDTAALGVDSGAEMDQVIAAGEEALGRNDLTTAFELFSRAYTYGQGDVSRTSRTALGLARVYFGQQEYAQAREYAVYVGQLVSSGEVHAAAQQVISQLDQLERASGGVADGVQAAEVRDTFQAGLDAYGRRDHRTAAQLFTAVHAAPVVDGAMRSSAAHNAGSAYRAMGEFDVALQWYEEAVRLGSADSQSRVDALRAGDRAMEQIGEDLLTGS